MRIQNIPYLIVKCSKCIIGKFPDGIVDKNVCQYIAFRLYCLDNQVIISLNDGDILCLCLSEVHLTIKNGAIWKEIGIDNNMCVNEVLRVLYNYLTEHDENINLKGIFWNNAPADLRQLMIGESGNNSQIQQKVNHKYINYTVAKLSNKYHKYKTKYLSKIAK